MIDAIFNGIGKMINDTTRIVMGTPNIPSNSAPCNGCGGKAVPGTNESSIKQTEVKFNADTGANFQPNRNQPYTNNTGIKFN